MPLNAEIEGPPVVSDRLDHAIVGGGRHPKLTGIGEGLAVVAVHRPPAQLTVHGVTGLGPVPVRAGQCVGQVLDERAAPKEPHELHAQTDAQDGDVPAALQDLQQGKLESLALRIHGRGLRVSGNTPPLHDRIVAAGKDEAVTPLHELGRGLRQTR